MGQTKAAPGMGLPLQFLPLVGFLLQQLGQGPVLLHGFHAHAQGRDVFRQGIFFLPAIVLLPLWLGCLGVEAAQSVADLCTFLICIPFLIYFYRKHILTPT